MIQLPRPPLRLADLILPELAADVLWLDAFLTNPDRTARSPNSIAVLRAVSHMRLGMALPPASERFHWVTAPRSDVLQASPVHEGVCHDPEAALDALFRDFVRGA